jgi:5'-methylthioadenosine phosphorylase
VEVKMNIDIAFIGGTGLYSAEEMENVSTVSIETPFGSPSGEIAVGEMSGRKCAFLPRHGVGHTVSPTNVNSRANIYALKTLGVTNIISISAVGSLREDIKPLDIVIPDQIFDRTTLRPNTFFDNIGVHVSFAEPFCKSISQVLYNTAQDIGGCVKMGGTYICIEGPQFSTRAESNAYRQMGFDIIGMTGIPEAKLAREAEICYGMLTTVTDYDVWREDTVSTEMVITNVAKNEKITKKIIKKVVEQLPATDETCACRHALRNAIVTNLDSVSNDVKQRLQLLIGSYL